MRAARHSSASTRAKPQLTSLKNVWVAQAIILNVIVKPLWSRPRMRVIEVTPGLDFQPWWVIGNPDKWTYIAAGVIKDGFKSFASGHTAHAAIGLMLAGLPAAAFKEKPGSVVRVRR